MQTSRKEIFAAGDVTGCPQFTHAAVWQGYAAARNALFPGRVRGARATMPWAVFTDPEVAQVGLTEGEVEAGGRRAQVHRWPVERIDRAQTEGDTAGFVKVITAGDERLLGATLVFAGAAEVANQVAIAFDAGVGLSQLTRVIHLYPTLGYGLFQLASEVRMGAAAKSRVVRLARRLRLRF